jgi:hypothetical protein
MISLIPCKSSHNSHFYSSFSPSCTFNFRVLFIP